MDLGRTHPNLDEFALELAEHGSSPKAPNLDFEIIEGVPTIIDPRKVKHASAYQAGVLLCFFAHMRATPLKSMQRLNTTN